MVIDWFTVGAQVLNFLVLVWLLKRFLYKPVLNAIDAREKRIAKTLADAAESKAQAAAERDALLAKNEAFDTERAAMLAKATDDARTEAARLADIARKAADDLKEKRQRALANDAANLSSEISRRATAEVFAVARKALSDLADSSLEERMTDAFIKKLGAMDEREKADVSTMLTTQLEPAILRSAFDLPARQREMITQAINATFGEKVEIRFQTAPDLIGGIELTAGGHKLAWSISDYLKSLERDVSELLSPEAAEAAEAA